MARADTAQKALLSFNDVFADIINARIFNGEQVVEPDALEDARATSDYTDETTPLSEYERDVIKIWRKNKIAFAIFGVENQNRFDPDMVFRMAAYDALSYRSQLKFSSDPDDRYPVISLLLYFGNQNWAKRLTLRDSIRFPTDARGNSLESKLAPFFNDYKLNLVEVAKMTTQELSLLNTDFKLLAGSNYQIIHEGGALAGVGISDVRHEEETLRCLQTMYGNDVARAARRQIRQDKGKVNMESYGQTLVQNLINKGHKIWFQKGHTKGFDEGHTKGFDEGFDQGELRKARASTLRMNAQGVPVSQIAFYLDVSPELVRQWIAEEEQGR